MRRIVLTLAMMMALPAGLPAAAYAVDAPVFTSWGGSTEAMQARNWLEPFTKKTGIPVLKDGPTNYGKFQAMVESGNVAWDVVDVEADFAAKAARDGLLEPLGLPASDLTQIDPRFVSPYSVGSFYFSFVLGYANPQGPHPANWREFFDIAHFPGKRALYKFPSPGVLEIALLADGVPPDQLYPLDLDRAFRKLDTIKSAIRWWSSGAQSQQMMAAGSVTAGMFWNGRLRALQEGGVDVGISWEQNITVADMLVIPRGARHADVARQLIGYAISAAPQAAFAHMTGYAPINLASLALMTPEDRMAAPQAHADSHIDPDIAYWAAHHDEIARRWYAWQAE